MRTAYPFQFGTVFLEWEDDILTGLSFKEESHYISEKVALPVMQVDLK